MGYGLNLKNALDEREMTSKDLALKIKVAPSTIYSIIQRDSSVRYDTALKIANLLDIPIGLICKDNPYDDIETLSKLPATKPKKNDPNKKAYASDRTLKILDKYEYDELPMVDQLIADMFVLDDPTRKDLFEYINLLKKNHTDPDRLKKLKTIK